MLNDCLYLLELVLRCHSRPFYCQLHKFSTFFVWEISLHIILWSLHLLPCKMSLGCLQVELGVSVLKSCKLRKMFSIKTMLAILDLKETCLVFIPFLNVKERKRRGDNNMQVFLGDIYTTQGKFAEAAKLYKKAGQPSRALNMYTDLCMFDLAKVWLITHLNYAFVHAI